MSAARPAGLAPLLSLSALLALSCGAGEGQGWVRSDRLYVEDCWNGPFDLDPTFFASAPFGNTQQIRIQRGDRNVEVSDGVLLVVEDVERIRSDLGRPIELGLPVGVNPPGFPERVDPDPPFVSLSLYLYGTCHVQNGALYAVEGTITFESLFSGDRNEDDARDRRTTASFRATVTDPRDAELEQDGDAVRIVYPDEKKSIVEGEFDFFFQRGIPAQPFP